MSFLKCISSFSDKESIEHTKMEYNFFDISCSKTQLHHFFIMRFHEIICQSEKNELNISAYVLNTMHNLHLMEQQTRELERLRPFKSPSHIIEFGTVRIVQGLPYGVSLRLFLDNAEIS